MDLSTIPTVSGVYLMKNHEGKVLYVGKARNLKLRVKQYFNAQDTRPNIPFLMKQVVEIQTIIVHSEKEALLLESTLIKKHQPRYNILLKDDKSFLYLHLTEDRVPRVELVRQKNMRGKEKLFGPYLNRQQGQQLLFFIQQHFPLRQCSDEELASRKRPCLLYEMKRCLGPCCKKCTEEEYAQTVTACIEFLRSKGGEWLAPLYQKVEELAAKMDFEAAAKLRDEIRLLEKALEPQSVIHARKESGMVLALYRQAEQGVVVLLLIEEGKVSHLHPYFFQEVIQEDQELLESFLLQYSWPEEPVDILLPFALSKEATEVLKERAVRLQVVQKGKKRKWLELAETNAKALFEQKNRPDVSKEQTLLDLQERLQLTSYPMTIECYDISHLAGMNGVASSVVYVDGIKVPQLYRKYALKGFVGDDLSGLRQVLHRRFLRGKPAPNCILIDGGKQQLQVAREVLDHYNLIGVDLIAIVKEEGRHDKGLSQERLLVWGQHDPVTLSRHSSLLFLLQQIRDEAHRFAIAYNRLLNRKRMRQSWLDQVPGIGVKKKQRLLSHFGSVAAIQQATDEELMEIDGVTRKDVAALKLGGSKLN